MKTALPAGKYYIGDPCYVIEDWDEFLAAFWAMKEEEGIFDYDVGTCCVLRTLWGDGSFPCSDGSMLGVDAGLIGAVPLILVTRGDPDQDGTVVEFDKPFACSSDSDGRLHFGNVSVMTGDEDDNGDY